MHTLKERETGVMFWMGRDSVGEIKSLGVQCGQLGAHGDADLSLAGAKDWMAALAREQFTLVTIFAAYDGESYADIPTVERTVGFIPRGSRDARERRTLAVSDFAAALGVNSIACHIGCVPENPAHPDYIAVRDLVRRVCDHAAGHGQTFALETGQEPAGVLLAF